MYWRNKRVLVTGGAGVIGRELIKKLSDLDADIICLDKAEKPIDIPIEVDYQHINILNISSDDIAKFYPEIIFHLAATFERVEETPDFWDENYKDNIIVSHRVIDAAMKCANLKKFIFPSSYLVYSPNLYLNNYALGNATKLNEKDHISPRNLIGSSKYYTEKELDFVSNVYGKFVCVAARIFRVYGCGSKDIISRWIRMALKGEELLLYNKENIFDYIYAGDVAEGLIKLTETINRNETINLGSGTPHRVQEIIEILNSHFLELRLKEIEVEYPVEGSCSDNKKLEELTNWHPMISLEEGIQRVIDYERVLHDDFYA